MTRRLSRVPCTTQTVPRTTQVYHVPRRCTTYHAGALSSFALALRLQVKCNPFVAIFVGSSLAVVGLSCTAFDALGDHKRGLSLTYMQAIGTRPGSPDDHCTPDLYMHKTGHPDYRSPISRDRGELSWQLSIASIYAAALG